MSKAPRRPKGDRGPACSQAFAREASAADPFAAFLSFGTAPAAAVASGGGGDGGGSAYAQVFKRLTKRDDTTKVAAVGELEALVTGSADEAVVPAIPEIAQTVKRRHYARDKQLRKGLARVLKALFEKGKVVKRKCVPYLGVLVGPWLCLMHDREVEVAAAAREAWEVAFPAKDKVCAAAAVCGDQVISLLAANLEVNEEVVKEEDGLKKEEAAEVVENLHTAILHTCAYFIELAAASDDALPEESADKLRHFLASMTDWLVAGPLWTLGASKLSRVRSAVYRVLVAYLQHQPDLLEAYEQKLSGFMMNAFNEKDPMVHGSMWPAILMWMKRFPECLCNVKNLQTTVFARLNAMLRRTSGVYAAKTAYLSLLPFLTLLPWTSLFKDNPTEQLQVFVDSFLTSLWAGMSSNSLPLQDVPALLEVWSECWCFFAAKLPAAAPAASLAFLITGHLQPVLRQAFFQTFRLPHAYRGNPVLLLAPALVQAERLPHHHAALLTFWTHFYEDVGCRTFTSYPADSTALLPARGLPAPQKKAAYERAGDDVEGLKVVFQRLAGFLEHLDKTSTVLIDDAKRKACVEYQNEGAVLLTTFLVGELEKWVASTEVLDEDSPGNIDKALASCWHKCSWEKVPGMLKQAYAGVLRPIIAGKLEGAAPGGKPAKTSKVPLPSLLGLASQQLSESAGDTADLLRAMTACAQPAAVGDCLAAVSFAVAPEAAFDEFLLAVTLKAAGDPQQWSTVCLQASRVHLSLGGTGEAAVRSLQQALQQPPKEPLKDQLLLLLLRVSGVAADARKLGPGLWATVAAAAIPLLLPAAHDAAAPPPQQADYFAPLTGVQQDALDEFSHLLSSPPDGVAPEQADDVMKNVVDDVLRREGLPVLLQVRILTLPCVKAETVLSGLRDTLSSLNVYVDETLSKALLQDLDVIAVNTYIVDGVHPHPATVGKGEGPKGDDSKLLQWRLGMEILARVTVHLPSFDAVRTESVSWVAAALAQGKIASILRRTGPLDVLPSGKLALLCDAAVHHVGAELAADMLDDVVQTAFGELRESVTNPSRRVTALGTAFVLRALCAQKTGKGAVLRHCAAHAGAEFSLAAMEWAMRARLDEDEDRPPGDGFAALDQPTADCVIQWCRGVAEKDEIGEDVPDDELLSALKVLESTRGAGRAESAETASLSASLLAAASAKLEQPAPDTAWGLRRRFGLLLSLIRALPAGEDVPPLDEISMAVAGLVQSYKPRYSSSWAAPDGAGVFPCEPCVLPAYAALLRELCSSPAVDPNVRSLLLTAGIDAVLFDATSPDRHCTEAHATFVRAMACLLGSEAYDESVAEVKEGLVETWSQRVLDAFIKDAAVPRSEGIKRHGDDDIVGGSGVGLKEHVICGLAAILARADVASLDEGGVLPPRVMQLVDCVARIGASSIAQTVRAMEGETANTHTGDSLELNTSPVTTRSPNLFGSLQNTQKKLIRINATINDLSAQGPLHVYIVGWNVLLSTARACVDVNPPVHSALVDAMKNTLPSEAISNVPSQNTPLHFLMDILGALLMTPREYVTQALRLHRVGYDAEEYTPFSEPDEPVDGGRKDVKNSLLSMTPAPGSARASNARPLPENVQYDAGSVAAFWSPGEKALAAVGLLHKLLATVPIAPRRWTTDCDPLLKEYFTSFVQYYLSPDLIRNELRVAVEKGGGKHTFSLTPECTVRVQPAAYTVVLDYEYDEVVSVKMVIPQSFPLSSIQHPALDAQNTCAKAGLKEDMWRRWLMQINAKLLNKSARLWDCIMMWQRNFTQHFNGQEACPICYSVVNTATQQLPSMVCSVCKGKYHKLCLYKWFKQSSDSTCPLCRSAWYSGTAAASSPTS